MIHIVRFKTPHIPGFTLIELSIVMIIVGLLAGFGLPAFSNVVLKEKIIKTAANQEEVAHALAAYILMHRRLPCPALPDGDGTAPLNCRYQPQRCQGVIPYRTLGLSARAAKDGFNHWMTYKVTPELTNTNMIAINDQQRAPQPAVASPARLPGMPATAQPAAGNLTHEGNTFCLRREPPIVVKVMDETGQSVQSPSSQDFIAFALISHGPEGAGAYTGEGEARFPVRSPAERPNSDESLNVQTAPYDPHRFTHKVFWATRNTFMAHYAKMPCVRFDVNSPAGS